MDIWQHLCGHGVKTECTLLGFQVVNEMEKDFDLLGITAVEDKIQIGVPETVGPGRARANRNSQMVAEHVSRIDNLDTNKLLDLFSQ